MQEWLRLDEPARRAPTRQCRMPQTRRQATRARERARTAAASDRCRHDDKATCQAIAARRRVCRRARYARTAATPRQGRCRLHAFGRDHFEWVDEMNVELPAPCVCAAQTHVSHVLAYEPLSAAPTKKAPPKGRLSSKCRASAHAAKKRVTQPEQPPAC
jgi:hypothetical protein